MHEFLHVLKHSLIDTLKIAPILLVVYFLIEFLEYKRLMQFEKSKTLKGRTSPVFGSLFGSLPQCGFSVISTDLFTKGYISIGALLSVYIATSDEALPIMISHGDSWLAMLGVVAGKIILGVVVGYLAMWLYPKVFKTKNLHYNVVGNKHKDKLSHENNEHGHEHHKHSHEKHEHHHEEEHANLSASEYSKVMVLTKRSASKLAAEIEVVDEKREHIGCCKHDLESGKFEWRHPLFHSLKILLFILIINCVFGLIIEWIGEDKLTSILEKNSVLQPLLAVMIGLIPNCASSVVLTELFLLDGLSFGAILAGLSVNAGLGLMVLFKQDKKPKEIAFILIMLIVPSLLVGYGLHFIF